VLSLSLSKAPVRFLDTLPPKQFRQVARKIIMLMADPRPTDAERLKGYVYSRVTAGEYRIIFDVHDGLLRVVAIGKRNDEMSCSSRDEVVLSVASNLRGTGSPPRADLPSHGGGSGFASAQACSAQRAAGAPATGSRTGHGMREE